MTGYAILFTGTPFLDGVYMEHSLAYACAESLRGQFPNLRVDLIQVGEGFRMSDDIFWASNLKELEILNSEGDERAKRTLTDVSVQSYNYSHH
jgi:hypothetical protein